MLGLRKGVRTENTKTYDLQYRRAASNDQWTVVTRGMKTVQDLEGEVKQLRDLAPSTEYEFQVRLILNGMPGAWSDSTIITTNTIGAFVE